MNIYVYPKSFLEQMWQEDRKQFAPDAENPPLCLRCGKPLHSHLVINALSRHADVHICEACGMDEAMRDAFDDVLPLREWYGVTCDRTVELPKEGTALTADCTFSHIFEGPKKLFPNSSLKHPASEVAYLRSDYNGRRWWMSWFHSSEELAAPELTKEIDQFAEALFRMPEFKNLSTMKRLCTDTAQPTGDPTEFNLYAETEHFHIWLRLITRFKDYNLYCHFYQKETAGETEH